MRNQLKWSKRSKNCDVQWMNEADSTILFQQTNKYHVKYEFRSLSLWLLKSEPNWINLYTDQRERKPDINNTNIEDFTIYWHEIHEILPGNPRIYQGFHLRILRIYKYCTILKFRSKSESMYSNNGFGNKIRMQPLLILDWDWPSPLHSWSSIRIWLVHRIQGELEIGKQLTMTITNNV